MRQRARLLAPRPTLSAVWPDPLRASSFSPQTEPIDRSLPVPPRRRLITTRRPWRLLGAACVLALTCCAGGPAGWWGVGHPAAAAAEPTEQPGVAGSYLAGLAAIDDATPLRLDWARFLAARGRHADALVEWRRRARRVVVRQHVA